MFDDLVRVIGKEEVSGEKVDLTNANVIVSGGVSLASKENFKLLDDLANVHTYPNNHRHPSHHLSSSLIRRSVPPEQPSPPVTAGLIFRSGKLEKLLPQIFTSRLGFPEPSNISPG